MAEIRRLIGEMEFSHPVTLVEGRYDTKEFYEMARGWRRFRRGENGVLSVTACGWKRRRDWRRPEDMIILPQH